MEADEHGITLTLFHDHGAALLERLHDAGTTAHVHPLAWLHEGGGRLRGREHVTDGGDADRGERSLLLLYERERVVGDEKDPMAGSTEIGDGIDRPGDRLVTEPDDTVQVAQDGGPDDGLGGWFGGGLGGHRLEIVPRSWHPVRVPRFEPFAAIRYDIAVAPLADVVAPPYDVLSDGDRAELADRHPRNIVHLDLPVAAEGLGPYETAATLLQSWLADGTLVVDDVPTFTLYRMEFIDESGRPRSTVGVIGALEVVDEGAGGVLPHERTTPKAKTDRLDLTRATRTNLSPVWGLSLTEGLSALLRDPGEPMGAVTVDAVTHSVERVTDVDRIAAISAAVGSHPVLIADGHHRYAIARTYRDEIRAATGRVDTPAELTLAFVGELVEDQLSIQAIHRLIDGITADDLAAALVPFFDQAPAGELAPLVLAQMAAQGTLCLVHPDGSGTFLRPKDDAFGDVRDLDSARLERALVGVEHEVRYQHGVANVLEAVRSGAASTAVLIRPVGIAEIRRTADEGLLMPPKSTFFTPKLRTGLVMRPLGD